MKEQAEFWELLLSLREGATRALLIIFVIGAVMIGLVSNLVYGALITPSDLDAGAVARTLGACGALLALAYGLYRHERDKLRRVTVQVDESRLAPPHRGLIWMLGPGPVEHALYAIRHHAQGQAEGQVVHVWLVMQRSNTAVQNAYSKLVSQVGEEKLAAQLEQVLVERLDVESAYKAVRQVFEKEAPAKGLAERDVIADITGATKPMTAGMVLAALDGARDLEYVESDRDDKGNVIPGTLRVVWLNKTFRLERSAGG